MCDQDAGRCDDLSDGATSLLRQGDLFADHSGLALLSRAQNNPATLYGVIVTTTATTDISTRIAKRVAKSVGPRRFAMWFDRSARFDYQNAEQTLRVEVPNRFVADWIGKHFASDLQEAAHHELGAQVALDVRIRPDQFAVPAATKVAKPKPAHTHRQPNGPSRSVAAGHHATPVKSLRHRLSDFVVGPSNELAYAAAQRLADEHAEPGHPLFIHGVCGLGKTHLLQGICRQMLEQQPSARVLYTTGEQFTNDYITAVRSNQLESFRKRIRKLDLLAVDDVHFIANKQATQQEFLHTFDHIELGGARVVLASDSHPKLIKQFSEALVSRCVRGLVVPITQPDAETRQRLIQKLAQRRHLVLEPTVVQTLGRRCVGSVREMEGMLTKLQALAQLSQQSAGRGQVVGHSLLRQLMDAEAAAEPRKPVRLDAVLSVVSQELGVTPEQVTGRSRHRLVVLARSLVIYLTRQLTPMSYPEIAAAMGRTNHSTIITAAQRVQKQLDADEQVMLPTQMQAMALEELVDQLRRAVVRA